MKAREAREAHAQPIPPQLDERVPPTIIVNVVPEKPKEEGEPLPKKPRTSGNLDSLLNKKKDQDTFLRDVVKAFAGSNVPLSKLEPDSPLRKLFEKYMTVNGESLGTLLVHPNNLRGTHLPKVLSEGIFFKI